MLLAHFDSEFIFIILNNDVTTHFSIGVQCTPAYVVGTCVETRASVCRCLIEWFHVAKVFLNVKIL